MLKPALAFGALIALAVGAPAHAALSPLYESIREIEAILKDESLAKAFANQEAIVSIASKSTDTYEERTRSCTVEVSVVDVPKEAGKPILIGPRKFTLLFDKPVCQ